MAGKIDFFSKGGNEVLIKSLVYNLRFANTPKSSSLYLAAL